jgi:hypothetical protein
MCILEYHVSQMNRSIGTVTRIIPLFTSFRPGLARGASADLINGVKYCALYSANT